MAPVRWVAQTSPPPTARHRRSPRPRRRSRSHLPLPSPLEFSGSPRTTGLNDHDAAQPQGRWTRLLKILPHGRSLSQPDWDRRHRAMLVVLGIYVVGLVAFGWLRGYSLPAPGRRWWGGRGVCALGGPTLRRAQVQVDSGLAGPADRGLHRCAPEGGQKAIRTQAAPAYARAA